MSPELSSVLPLLLVRTSSAASSISVVNETNWVSLGGTRQQLRMTSQPPKEVALAPWVQGPKWWCWDTLSSHLWTPILICWLFLGWIPCFVWWSLTTWGLHHISSSNCRRKKSFPHWLIARVPQRTLIGPSRSRPPPATPGWGRAPHLNPFL